MQDIKNIKEKDARLQEIAFKNKEIKHAVSENDEYFYRDQEMFRADLEENNKET